MTPSPSKGQDLSGKWSGVDSIGNFDYAALVVPRNGYCEEAGRVYCEAKGLTPAFDLSVPQNWFAFHASLLVQHRDQLVKVLALHARQT
jgi:hypothetical protein